MGKAFPWSMSSKEFLQKQGTRQQIRFRAIANGPRRRALRAVEQGLAEGKGKLAYAKSAKTDLSRAGRRSVAMIVEAIKSAAKETR